MENDVPKPERSLYQKMLRYALIMFLIGIGVMLVELFVAQTTGLL